MDRALEVWAVGTSSLVLVVLGALLAGHVGGELTRTLPRVGTATATILFGYLWLLTLVVAGQGRVVDVESDHTTRLLGDAAMAGGGVAVVFLTVVLVVGFVAPVPTPVAPEPAVVSRVVLLGAVVGAVGGVVLASFFLGCDRLAAVIVSRGEE